MMKRMAVRIKDYLLQPENGAGLLYVALAFGVLRLWLLHAYAAYARNAGAADWFVDAFGGSQATFFAWTLVSFALSVWLAFLLLRRRLPVRAMRRVMLVAFVHAIGALRFYDWGLLLLSILPLFAIAPVLLLPSRERRV